LLIFSEGPAARNRTNRSVDAATRATGSTKKNFTVAKQGYPPYFYSYFGTISTHPGGMHMQKTAALPTVGNLKKITLTIEAGTSANKMDITARPQSMTFVYGLGTTGLSPFEYALADKSTGDVVLVSIRPGERARTFGHLQPPFATKPDDTAEVHLRVRVDKIIPAEGREIISAMAAAAECGCDCGCGGKHGVC
jgi:hypothetical protein